MKDIYSPLEIDEEWDQRAPDMGANEGGGTSVAVAPAPEVTTAVGADIDTSTSTLPPEQVADASVDTEAPMAGDKIEPNGDMMHDPAHDAAEAVVSQPTYDGKSSAPAPADTLDISDMNSNPVEGVDVPANDNVPEAEAEETGAAVVPEVDEGVKAAEEDTTEPMKVNVMGDTESDEPDSKVEAGETFNPETFPGGKIPEPEAVGPEIKEEPAEEPELPTTPVVEKEEVTKDEEPEVEVAKARDEDMDSTDKRLMAAIDRWKEKKAQEVKDLTELREKVETDIAKMNDEIADLQGRVSTKEGELDSIGQLLDEIGEVEKAA